MPKAFKDAPLAEITLRKYEPPYTNNKRDLVKKLCLSLGLLQPGDSRDIITDIFLVIITNKKPITSKEIESKVLDSRKKHNLPPVGTAGSNIRRQIKRLKDLFLIEKVQNSYRITEKATLSDIFEEKIKRYHLESITSRVKEYCQALDQK